MTKSRALLLTHMLLAALVCSLHHWVAISINRGDYTPFSVSPSVSALTFDETHAYAPAARRLLLLGRLSAEADNAEHGSWSAGIPFLPEALLAGLARVTGGSLEWAFIAADAVFPALLLALYYRIAGSFVASHALRLLVAWASLLIPFNLLNTFWLGADALLAPLEITRTPQPEISFPILIVAALALARVFKPESGPRSALLAGVASAAVVYCYYFYAVAWACTLAILIAFAAWGAKKALYKILLAAGTMLVLSIPFLLQVLRGRREGGEMELLFRMGSYTRHPAWLPLAAALLVLCVLGAGGRRWLTANPACFVLAALFVASLCAMNVQLITGYETQPWHFWKRLGLPVAFLLAAGGAAQLAEKSQRKSTLAIANILLALCIPNACARQAVAAFHFAGWQRASSPEISLVASTRRALPDSSVVGTVNPELILLIPALTANYTYVPSGLRSLTSSAEIAERFNNLACLLGMTPAEVASLAAAPNHLAHSTELLQVLGLSYTGERVIYQRFVEQYARGERTCPAPLARLDFLIVPDPSPHDSALAAHFPGAREILRNSQYRVLDVRPKNSASR